jgi:hypothetical protein
VVWWRRWFDATLSFRRGSLSCFVIGEFFSTLTFLLFSCRMLYTSTRPSRTLATNMIKPSIPISKSMLIIIFT